MTSTTDLLQTAEKRVKNGAEYLDRVRPDWAEEIWVNYLDMESVSYCILGQLGLWDTAPIDIISCPGVTEHGFFRSVGDPVTYELLQYCWLVEISKRV